MVPSCGHYYNIYRIMLTAIGLWPYQIPIVMQVQSVFFLSAYYFILLFQVFLDLSLLIYNIFLSVYIYIDLIYSFMCCSLRLF